MLTAHPTEATRRTVLSLQARVADALLARTAAPESERKIFEDRIEYEIELLWLTSEVRRDRLSVLDEVSTVVWYMGGPAPSGGPRARATGVPSLRERL